MIGYTDGGRIERCKLFQNQNDEERAVAIAQIDRLRKRGELSDDRLKTAKGILSPREHADD